MTDPHAHPSGSPTASFPAAEARPPLADTFERMRRLPCGRWLFGRMVCWKAPYFSTIAPRFLRVEPGRCEVEIPDRRAVHNHIGTVHAIALCNLAELAGGVMMEATTPRSMRWIPKGMTVEYLAKAIGSMHAIARPTGAVEDRDTGYEVPVTVEVRDTGDVAVFRACIAMWVSPRPSKRAGVSSVGEASAPFAGGHERDVKTKPS